MVKFLGQSLPLDIPQGQMLSGERKKHKAQVELLKLRENPTPPHWRNKIS